MDFADAKIAFRLKISNFPAPQRHLWKNPEGFRLKYF